MKHLLNTVLHSLAARLLLLFIGITGCLTLLTTGSLMYGFSSQWKNNIRPHLFHYLSYVSQEIGVPPDLDAAKKLSNELPINIYINGKGMHFTSTGKPLDVDDLEFHEDDHHKQHRRFKLQHKPDSHLLPRGRISFGEHHERTILRHRIGEYHIYYELSHQKRRDQRLDVLQKTLIILMVIFVISYWLLRRQLKPIKDIDNGVSAMRAGELDYRIPVYKPDDLGELSQNINTMAKEINDMLDAKRQLLLAVSHELRSPLTRAKLALQMMATSKHQAAVTQDIEEMESLINEILEAERINNPHATLHITEVDVPTLIQHVTASFDQDHVIVEPLDTLPIAHWDETRIRLLLRNIISNAIRYSEPATHRPSITVNEQQGNIIITVTDHGCGISEADLDKVTEPFYRADPSRTRATGGFGLGLYLCKLIVEAHHGQLTISSTVEQGTRVTAALPINAIQPQH